MTRFNNTISSISLLITLLLSGVSAEYIEGTDTTDAKGYCRDSSFFITEKGMISGAQIVKYYHDGAQGYFNYAFDEILLAPETPGTITIKEKTLPIHYCFAVKRKNGTYMKVQIQKKLDNGRYIYKYGNNTVPADRLLERQDYDRSIKYKPNNLYFNYEYATKTTISWEPPLPGNNNLTGYILYTAPATIDTTAPFDISQWDSVVVEDTSVHFVTFPSRMSKYYNVVAVYSEGRSEFLKGWTREIYFPNSINYNAISGQKKRNPIFFKYSSSSGYLTFTSPSNLFDPLLLILYDATGRRITSFSAKNGETVYLNSGDYNLAGGMYIVKAMAGNEVLAKQAFSIVR
ncbi:MAG: fibronectin type III domain-containing protein [Fibrobacter sp.]|nr:fibronectin type III domain-containing protein [Fibrobacter sp.]